MFFFSSGKWSGADDKVGNCEPHPFNLEPTLARVIASWSSRDCPSPGSQTSLIDCRKQSVRLTARATG
jgi:hypothetical protein